MEETTTFVFLERTQHGSTPIGRQSVIGVRDACDRLMAEGMVPDAHFDLIGGVGSMPDRVGGTWDIEECDADGCDADTVRWRSDGVTSGVFCAEHDCSHVSD